MVPTFTASGSPRLGAVVRRQTLLFVVVSALLFQVNAQECGIHLTCGDCIRTVGCAWCASNSQSFQREGARRCDTVANLRARSCDNIEDPHSKQIGSRGSNATSNPINVSDVELSLRVGETHTFSVTVTPLRNQPLDLYILIDLSASMGRHLRALKQSAGEIANGIRNVTDNVRVGFGSFNDKPTRPYTYVPVPSGGRSCPACNGDFYSFRHQITLTENITFYNEAIQGVDLTTNADRPENGLEGLAQVLACENIIGWRNRSARGMERGLTRVVLYMTDAAFHYAGEGQLAGILNPYGGECLLDPAPSNTGPAGATEFTRWREVDYPSVGQITQMLYEQEVSVIFAVVDERLNTYRNLTQLINSVSKANVAQLRGDSNSILTLISDEISNILQEVSLRSDESGSLNFTITPSCPNGSAILENGRGCNNIPLQTPVKFQINVTLKNCEEFQQSNAPRVHRVVAPGLGSEFAITYTGECECSCAENTTIASQKCTGNGDYLCGVCECYEGWCGPSCDQRFDAEQDEVCRRGGVDNDICSGPQRGVCRCSCECFDSYFGPACECDRNDESCPRNANGEHCSGQGDCCDGRCRCREDENGHQYRHNGTTENCACPPREAVCIYQLQNNTECSGNGRCGCTGCICNNGFFGDFCQSRDVGTCGNSMDILCIERCVNASFNRDVCMSCETTRPLIVMSGLTTTTMLPADLEEIANTELVSTGDEFTYNLDCETIINNDCTYGYYLLRGSQMYAIILDTTPAFCISDSSDGINLPFAPYYFAPMIFGVLLILGIIIFVLAKIVISALDYLEVKRLDKETKDLDFSKNQNPLYQSPDMKYDNVAYGHE